MVRQARSMWRAKRPVSNSGVVGRLAAGVARIAASRDGSDARRSASAS
jgi:hypothetical protein